MACAQCHTHKFDPITHNEYFSFYSLLNQTEDADRNEPRLAAAIGPSLPLHKKGAGDHRHHCQAEEEGAD
jgi:hypothetical protein